MDDYRYESLHQFVSVLNGYYIKLESGNSKFQISHRKLLGSIISGIIKSQYSSDIILKDARVVTICEPLLQRMRLDSYWKLRLMCFTLLSNTFDSKVKQSNNSSPLKSNYLFKVILILRPQ